MGLPIDPSVLSEFNSSLQLSVTEKILLFTPFTRKPNSELTTVRMLDKEQFNVPMKAAAENFFKTSSDVKFRQIFLLKKIKNHKVMQVAHAELTLT